MEPKPWKEMRAPRSPLHPPPHPLHPPPFCPSHLFTRGKGDVSHFTLWYNGGWKKATGRRGRWGKTKGGFVKGPEEALRCTYHGYPCFGPFGWSTITLVGSSSCHPPILFAPPLILHQPLSHTSYGCRGSKTWISQLLGLLCNYPEGEEAGG